MKNLIVDNGEIVKINNDYYINHNNRLIDCSDYLFPNMVSGFIERDAQVVSSSIAKEVGADENDLYIIKDTSIFGLQEVDSTKSMYVLNTKEFSVTLLELQPALDDNMNPTSNKKWVAIHKSDYKAKLASRAAEALSSTVSC